MVGYRAVIVAFGDEGLGGWVVLELNAAVNAAARSVAGFAWRYGWSLRAGMSHCVLDTD